ncbi:MAG: hypothetical protein QM523_10705 [Candidatus Pacebacteria bacterium]|nr:hypothetical protein [Candidatus Paceibacterota bacterium]
MGFFPIILDLSRVPIILVAKGRQGLNRLRQFDAERDLVTVFSDDPSPEFLEFCHGAVIPRLPLAADLRAGGVLFIGDYAADQAREIAAAGRAAGMLTNVEDLMDGCDFHTPSMVRRGNLLLTVSTGGHSPAMAVAVKEYLADKFSDDWSARLAEMAAMRQQWKSEGRSYGEIKKLSAEFMTEQKWFEGM